MEKRAKERVPDPLITRFSSKKLINIKTADHNFNNWRDEDMLFKKTYEWLTFWCHVI